VLKSFNFSHRAGLLMCSRCLSWCWLKSHHYAF